MDARDVSDETEQPGCHPIDRHASLDAHWCTRCTIVRIVGQSKVKCPKVRPLTEIGHQARFLDSRQGLLKIIFAYKFWVSGIAGSLEKKRRPVGEPAAVGMG
jgi:hypothetical protein